MIRFCHVLAITLALWSTSQSRAMAQAAATAGLDPPVEWTLDQRKAKARGKTAAQARRLPAEPDEKADQAARLAEARRKFFEHQPDAPKSQAIPEFGGYDPQKASEGAYRPGATFRF